MGRRCSLGLSPVEPSNSALLLFGSTQVTSGCPLTAAQVRSLCSRDITPEDYDLLLQLDEAAPASSKISAADCERLEAPEPNGAWLGETCMVCLSGFSED